jgi:hypothetical protein
MPLDFGTEILGALRNAEVRASLRELMIEAAEEGARRALEKHAETWEPLGKILGCSNDAARMRISRDPELAAIGMRDGRRVMFRRSQVLALLSLRQGKKPGASLRLIKRNER